MPSEGLNVRIRLNVNCQALAICSESGPYCCTVFTYTGNPVDLSSLTRLRANFFLEPTLMSNLILPVFSHFCFMISKARDKYVWKVDYECGHLWSLFLGVYCISLLLCSLFQQVWGECGHWATTQFTLCN